MLSLSEFSKCPDLRYARRGYLAACFYPFVLNPVAHKFGQYVGAISNVPCFDAVPGQDRDDMVMICFNPRGSCSLGYRSHVVCAARFSWPD
jgi:hypothetical protein